MFITFDKFYDINQYNDFVNNARSAGLDIKEYIEARPPYNWYIKISEKYLPVFLKYKIASKESEKYLLEKLIPLYPNEEYILKRKIFNLPQSFDDFVSPNIFKKISSEAYCCLFRYKNKEQLIRYSKESGIKIWLLGTHREWNLAFSFNKYIRNYIYTSDVILEKNKMSQFTKQGEFEVELNYKKLVKVKLNNKLLDYPYIDEGVYYPLQKMPKGLNLTFK